MNEQFEDRDTEPMIKAAAPVSPPAAPLTLPPSPSPSSAAHIVDVEYVRLYDTVLDVSPTQTYYVKWNRKLQPVRVRLARTGVGREHYHCVRTSDGKVMSRTVTTSSLYLPRAEACRLAMTALAAYAVFGGSQ